jgi:casein kinase 1 alpha
VQGFPVEFVMYLKYCRGLRFEEVPDYTYLRQLFRILFRTLKFEYDFVFDWTKLLQNAAEQTSLPGNRTEVKTEQAANNN